ncbi:hypothetical protein [Pedobacter sp. UBA4863]|uniref:hypothetical protein n=1 Tax=Pedobacter sp. UBA4863 TaxID=1947060 RepID=UPI0025D385D6|nr:hypothetical protein [Pedobacter sp. UBA4863]
MISAFSRLRAELDSWHKREERFEKLFPNMLQENRPFQEEKWRYASSVIHRYKDVRDDDVAVLLRLVRQQNAELEKKLFPGFWNRLFNRMVNHYRMSRSLGGIQNPAVHDPLRALKAALVKSGFESVIKKLEEQVQSDKKELVLQASRNFSAEDRMDYRLEIAQDNAGTYFLKGLHAELNGAEKTTSAYFSTEDFTELSSSQAYNFLNGRPIVSTYENEQGERQMVWKQLDLLQSQAEGKMQVNEFHPTYGFDITKELDRIEKNCGHSIPRQEVLKSMEEGRRMAIELSLNGNKVQCYLQANPAEKRIDIYDASQQKIDIDKQEAITVGRVIAINSKQDKIAAPVNRQKIVHRNRRKLGI